MPRKASATTYIVDALVRFRPKLLVEAISRKRGDTDLPQCLVPKGSGSFQAPQILKGVTCLYVRAPGLNFNNLQRHSKLAPNMGLSREARIITLLVIDTAFFFLVRILSDTFLGTASAYRTWADDYRN